MARPDKAAAVAELVESFRECNDAVLTDYRGVTDKDFFSQLGTPTPEA